MSVPSSSPRGTTSTRTRRVRAGARYRICWPRSARPIYGGWTTPCCTRRMTATAARSHPAAARSRLAAGCSRPAPAWPGGGLVPAGRPLVPAGGNADNPHPGAHAGHHRRGGRGRLLAAATADVFAAPRRCRGRECQRCCCWRRRKRGAAGACRPACAAAAGRCTRSRWPGWPPSPRPHPWLRPWSAGWPPGACCSWRGRWTSPPTVRTPTRPRHARVRRRPCPGRPLPGELLPGPHPR